MLCFLCNMNDNGGLNTQTHKANEKRAMLAAMDSQPGAQRMPTYSVGSARFLAG